MEILDPSTYALKRTSEENKLRKMLFMSHQHHNKPDSRYGDDGEMRCNLCQADFVRDSCDQLEVKATQFVLAHYKTLLDSVEN